MDNNNPEQTSPKENSSQATQSKGLAQIVVLALVFGFIGGLLGNAAVESGFMQSQTPLIQKPSFQAVNGDIVSIVKEASPAVVSIVISKDVSKIPGYGLSPFDDSFFNFFSRGQNYPTPTTPNVQQVGAGSGFFISEDGLILTNRHVVDDEQASYAVLTSDGKKYDAEVLSKDPINDLAIVKVKITNARKLILADSGQTQIGEQVIAIGNSLGEFQNTVTSGIVSGIGRSITAGDSAGTEDLSGVIQTDAAINPGNSGGPLLNLAGQVIGINTAIDEQGQLVGFAIPSNDASQAVASFQKTGRITRPFLGVRYVMISQALADQEKLDRNYGAYIVPPINREDVTIVVGSPAEKAGLNSGDIILEINGSKLNEQNTLALALKNFNPGDTITLRIYHRGNEKDIQAVLSEAKAK